MLTTASEDETCDDWDDYRTNENLEQNLEIRDETRRDDHRTRVDGWFKKVVYVRRGKNKSEMDPPAATPPAATPIPEVPSPVLAEVSTPALSPAALSPARAKRKGKKRSKMDPPVATHVPEVLSPVLVEVSTHSTPTVCPAREYSRDPGGGLRPVVTRANKYTPPYY